MDELRQEVGAAFFASHECKSELSQCQNAQAFVAMTEGLRRGQAYDLQKSDEVRVAKPVVDQVPPPQPTLSKVGQILPASDSPV